MTSLTRRVLRTAAGLAAGVLLAASIAGTADATPPQPDLAAASAAARSADAGKLIDRAAAHAAQRAGKAASSKAATVVQQDAVPVYALNPQFVTGKSGEVASLWYVATSASKGGAQLTVYTAPEESTGSWQAVNVATGNTESRMAALARGAQLFTEPQIGAWYALNGDRIRPLNPSATDSIGTKPITVDAYRTLVTARYADKQPGSTYAKNGTAGGYDAADGTAGGGGAVTAVGAGVTSAPVQAATSASSPWLLGGAAAVAAVAAALVLYRRRRLHA